MDLNINYQKKKNSVEVFNLIKNINILAPYKLVKTMRAGILVLGPLLAKYKKAKISLPGGCAIGTRPVDLHLFALKNLEQKLKLKMGIYLQQRVVVLKVQKLNLRISVGVTENTILASVQWLKEKPL